MQYLRNAAKLSDAGGSSSGNIGTSASPSKESRSLFGTSSSSSSSSSSATAAPSASSAPASSHAGGSTSPSSAPTCHQCISLKQQLEACKLENEMLRETIATLRQLVAATAASTAGAPSPSASLPSPQQQLSRSPAATGDDEGSESHDSNPNPNSKGSQTDPSLLDEYDEDAALNRKLARSHAHHHQHHQQQHKQQHKQSQQSQQSQQPLAKSPSDDHSVPHHSSSFSSSIGIGISDTQRPSAKTAPGGGNIFSSSSRMLAAASAALASATSKAKSKLGSTSSSPQGQHASSSAQTTAPSSSPIGITSSSGSLTNNPHRPTEPADFAGADAHAPHESEVKFGDANDLPAARLSLHSVTSRAPSFSSAINSQHQDHSTGSSSSTSSTSSRRPSDDTHLQGSPHPDDGTDPQQAQQQQQQQHALQAQQGFRPRMGSAGSITSTKSAGNYTSSNGDEPDEPHSLHRSDERHHVEIPPIEECYATDPDAVFVKYFVVQLFAGGGMSGDVFTTSGATEELHRASSVSGSTQSLDKKGVKDKRDEPAEPTDTAGSSSDAEENRQASGDGTENTPSSPVAKKPAVPVFEVTGVITEEDKTRFAELCQQEKGRVWFSRLLDKQRAINMKVEELTFFRLQQFIAVALNECTLADDFMPAKILMNMCFTFYHVSDRGEKEYLHTALCSQPIWQSLRFWTAAYFSAVASEKGRHPQPWSLLSEEQKQESLICDANVAFGQLGTFTNNMLALGVSRHICETFLEKMAIVGNVDEDQLKLLWENMNHIRPKVVVKVVLEKDPQLGFGFSIESIDEDMVVTLVRKNGPAFNSGKIEVGDCVLSINQFKVRKMTVKDLPTVLKDLAHVSKMELVVQKK